MILFSEYIKINLTSSQTFVGKQFRLGQAPRTNPKTQTNPHPRPHLTKQAQAKLTTQQSLPNGQLSTAPSDKRTKTIDSSGQGSEVIGEGERSQESSSGEKQDSIVVSERVNFTNQEVHLSGRGTLVSQARLRSASSE